MKRWHTAHGQGAPGQEERAAGSALAADARKREHAHSARRARDEAAVLRDERRWEEVRADKDSWKGRSNRESVKGADLITHTYAPTADGARLACVDDAVKQRAQARSEHFRQRGHNNTLCGYNPIFG